MRSLQRALFRAGILVFILLWGALDTRISGHALAQAPLGFPGFTWGQVRFPSSQEIEEKDNVIVEGAIEQGVDWFRVTSRSIFNSFVRFEYKFDRENFDFNNKLQPEIGVKAKYLLADWGLIEVGGKYVVDYRFETHRTEQGIVFFVNWAASWNLKKN